MKKQPSSFSTCLSACLSLGLSLVLQPARSRRGGVPYLHRCIAAVRRRGAMALLLVLAAVAFAAPARAAVLVSNLGQSAGGGATLDTFDKAQAFTTGANTDGYTLTSVELKIGTIGGSNVYTVSIWSSNSSGRPNSSLGTLTNPASLTANSNNTFTASGSGIDLSASTPYLVVVDGTSGIATVRNVNSAASANAEDATSATGWSIADDSLFRTASSTGSWSTFNESMYIQVNGAAKTTTVTAPGAPTNFAATAGDAAVTLLWAAPASDGGGAITEYEYRHSTGSTVSASATWTDVTDGSDSGTSTADETGVTVSGLTNGTQYAFEVRAVNSAGGGTATATQTATPVATSCDAPSFGTRRNIWTGSLTVGSGVDGTTGVIGFGGTTGALDDKTFSIGSNSYEIDAIVVDARVNNSIGFVFSLKNTNSRLTTAEKAALRLHLCNTTYDFSAATPSTTQRSYRWNDTALDWSSLSSRTLYLSLPANNAATGAPTISGAALVGETLMAAKGTIADVDGVPTTLTYQWLRVDGANETDIPGETGSTYTVTAADIGKTLKVKVGFTDNFDGEESRTSAATATVAQPPTVSIAAVYPTATPGYAHPEFRVTIDSAQPAAVQVSLAITQDSDYLSNTSPTITILAGETSATGKLTAVSPFGRTSGTLTATVIAGDGYQPAAAPASVATVSMIINNPQLIFHWQEAAYTVTEGDTLMVTVTLRTAAGLPRPREVFGYGFLTLGGTATLNVDYTHTSRTVRVQPGDWSADGTGFVATNTVSVATLQDDAIEGIEQFRVSLSAAAGHRSPTCNVGTPAGTVDSPTCETAITLIDDDSPSVSIAAVYPTATPGYAHPEFRVTIDSAQPAAVQVSLAITQDSDYLSNTSPTITILAGETSATGKLTAVSPFGRTSGTLTATVIAGDGYQPAAAPASVATVSMIINNPQLIFHWQEAAYTVTEGDTLMVTVTLRTAAGLPRPREVFGYGFLTLEGTATLNVDYTHTSRTVRVQPGDWSADGTGFVATNTVSVATLQDDAIEGIEQFRVSLSAAAGHRSPTCNVGTPAGTVDSPTCETAITLIDDDSPPVITIAADTTPVTEGAAAAFTLSRTGTTTAALTVGVTVSESGAMVAAAEKGAKSVRFEANSASASLSVATLGDTTSESDSVVTATVADDSADPATYTPGTPASATVTVADNDSAGVTISTPALSVDEGGSDTYTVVLTSQPTGEVTVTPSSDNSDVTFSPAVLTFTASNWNSAQTVTVSAAEDADSADDNATIAHAVTGADYALVTAAGVSVTVTDNDLADSTAPRVVSIVRQVPTTSPTNADSLIWRVTFNEAVQTIDAADFALSGSTATLAVSAVSASEYTVTASGGNLAGLDGTATLSFATGQNIQDLAGNALANTTPTGTNNASYAIDNTAPTLAISGVPVTSNAPFTATFTFSEDITGFVVGDISLVNARLSAFTTTSGAVYTALITPAADGTVTLDVAADVAEDTAGNDNTAAARASSRYTAPVAVLPVVTIAAGTTPVIEGTDATFTLSRTGATTAALTVSVGVTETGEMVAAANKGTQSVSFGTGSANATLSVATLGDTTDEDDSAVTATVAADTADPATYTPGTPASATVTVTDNDTAIDDSFVVEFVQSTLTLEEDVDSRSNSLPIEVRISGPRQPGPREFILFDIKTVAGTATEADYRPLNFPNGVSAQRFEFSQGSDGVWTAIQTYQMTSIADRVDEPDEQFTVVLSRVRAFPSTFADVSLGATTRVTVTIADNDEPNTAPTAANGTVTTEEDTAYTFRAGDFNFADADTGHVLDSVRVVSLPTAGALTLDGAAVTAGQAIATGDLGDLAFTPAADANGAAYANFTFRVSDGIEHSVAANTITIAVTAVNDAPTGRPTVAGTAQVGETLSALVSEIADADGLSGASFTYQWWRVDADGSSNPVEITGETGTTYVLTTADIGKRIQVAVRYSDDDGTAEGPLSSAAWPSSGTVTAVVLPTITIASDTTPVTEGTAARFTLSRTGATTDALTVSVSVTESGAVVAVAEEGTKSVTFEIGEATAALSVATVDDRIDAADSVVTATVADDSADPATYTPGTPASATVTVADNDTAGVTVSESALEIGEGGSGTYTLVLTSQPTGEVTVTPSVTGDSDVTVSAALTFTTGNWNTAQTVTVSAAEDADTTNDSATIAHNVAGADYASVVVAAVAVTVTDNDEVNRPATGAPVIEGALTMASVLTADTSQIRDADGLDGVVYRYQWLRIDGAGNGRGEREIAGATEGRYRISEQDIGHRLRLRVAFADARDNHEQLYSAPTAAVSVVSREVAQAWLGRFGRTVSEQVLTVVDGRLHSSREAGSSLRLAGHELAQEPGDKAGYKPDDGWGWRVRDKAEEGLYGAYGGRGVSGREWLTGSSFNVTSGSEAGNHMAFWGGVAANRFSGQQEAVAIEGEVISGQMGADWRRRWGTAGLLLSHARGEGDYRVDDDSGTIESTLTGVYPFIGYTLNDRTSLWGVAGYGSGESRYRSADGGGWYTSDLSLSLAAAGIRTVVRPTVAGSGLELSLVADGLLLRAESDASLGIAAESARVNRVRTGVEGRWHGLGSGLTPVLELGLRHDGGDVEKGFGADLGGGVDWHRGRFELQVRGRGLLTHEDSAFRNRGFSGMMSWQSQPSSTYGLKLRMQQSVGGSATGGVAALHGRETIAGLHVSGSSQESPLSPRTEMSVAYGMPFGRYFIGTPEVGLGITDQQQDYRVGWRLDLRRNREIDFALGLEVRRRENLETEDAGYEATLQLRANW